jgi:hypothetical protein
LQIYDASAGSSWVFNRDLAVIGSETGRQQWDRHAPRAVEYNRHGWAKSCPWAGNNEHTQVHVLAVFVEGVSSLWGAGIRHEIQTSAMQEPFRLLVAELTGSRCGKRGGSYRRMHGAVRMDTCATVPRWGVHLDSRGHLALLQSEAMSAASR